MSGFYQPDPRNDHGAETGGTFVSETGTRHVTIGSSTADCSACGATNAACCNEHGGACCLVCLDSIVGVVPDPHRNRP